ncbi:MAG: alpha/beta hydrolase [bacterium]|nr:alpha/beta hydrolase [bacterium]
MIEKQIILKDLLINYYLAESTNPAAKTAIFLHGWRANGMIWIPIVKFLKGSDFNIYCLDLPGFGKSENPRTAFHLRDYAEIVVEFQNKLGIAGANLVGHSFGGRVAVKVAVDFPKLVDKLVLVSCGGFRAWEWKRGLITFLAKVMKPAFALPLLKRLRPRIYHMLGADDYLTVPELKSTFLNVINEDIKELASDVAHETLIIWGEKDIEVPVEFGRALETLIFKSKLFVYPDTGHFAFLGQPEDFARRLKDFFDAPSKVN